MKVAARVVLVALLAAVALLVAALVMLNPAPVMLQLGVVDLPAVGAGTLIVITLGAGVLLGGGAAGALVLRRAARERTLRRRVGALEQELHDLRTLPLKDEI